MQKNVSGQKWPVYAYNRATGAPLTGDAANISASLSQDSGAAAPLADAHPDEIGGGFYTFDISQAESNASFLILIAVSTTAKIVVIGWPAALWTEPASQKYAATLASADVSGNLPAQVKAQDNIDFGALQKASLNAATPAVTVSDKSGFSLSVDGILAIWHQALSAIATSSTIGKLIKDYLDAAISSRSTYAGGAVASVTAGVTVATNNDKNGYSLSTAPPTASDIKTAIEGSEVLAKVADLPGEAPTVEAIREEMDDHSTKLAGIASEANSSRVIIDAIADTGSYPVGSKLWTYTVRRSDTHAVVPGATVEAYNDEACSPANLVQSAISNASGVATFRLIPGVYYILVIAPGYNVPDADREVVT